MENWQTVLEEIENSGMSIAQYCRENGLKQHTVRYWKQKRKTIQNASGGFVRVNTPTIEKSAVEIIYPNGVRLKLSSTYSIKDLKSLLDV